MPGYLVTKNDEYICYSIKLPKGKYFIKAFEPIADLKIVHHMTVFSCLETSFVSKTMACGSLCSKGKPKGMFVWARQAYSFELPKDTTFAVGDETEALYIGLQMHYGKPTDKKDYSGFNIYWTANPSKYDAGVLFLEDFPTNIVPPNQSHFLYNESCQYNLSATLYPFAYRTHAHDLGRSVLAYHFSSDKTKMIEIGKTNPKWPQTFRPIKTKFAIKNGDYLAVQCVYDSRNKSTNTLFWSRHEDEMCVFYIMYAMESNQNRKKPFELFHCIGNQFPSLFSQLPSNNSDYMPEQIPTNYFATKFVDF